MGKRWMLFFTIVLLFCLSLLPLVNLLYPGLPVTHDGKDHVARIASFYASLQDGIIVPRWAANLNWGYGHPILMFLYPFSSYLGSFFHFLGMSLVDSVKLVFGVTFVASIFSMYLWVSAAWGKRAGFLAGLLYGFAPYRFVDLYVRGAIGEHAAFVFPPLILYFLYRLGKSTGWSGRLIAATGISVATAFLILSHNAISMMFLPIILLYGIYMFWFETKKSLSYLFGSFASLGLGFASSAFFWIPAFFEGKYTLRYILTAGSVMDKFVPPLWFLYSPWNFGQSNDFSKSIGLIQWIGVVSAVYACVKAKRTSIRIFLLAMIISLVISLFFMTGYSKAIWSYIVLLQTFQFPWRILSVSVFCAAVGGGIGIAMATRAIRFGKIVIAVVAIGLLASTYHMWQAKGYLREPESYYSGIYEGTTDTGESSPIWSVRFMEHKPAQPMEIIEGQATIAAGIRTTTTRTYQVTAEEPTRLLENTLYFPGWNVFVDGVRTDVQFQDPNYRGLMTFHIPVGTHKIRIVFGDTKVRSLSNTMSLIGWGIVGLIVLGAILCKKRK